MLARSWSWGIPPVSPPCTVRGSVAATQTYDIEQTINQFTLTISKLGTGQEWLEFGSRYEYYDMNCCQIQTKYQLDPINIEL